MVLAAWGQPARGPGPQGGGRAQGAECWVLAAAPGWRRWQERRGSPPAPSVAPGPHPWLLSHIPNPKSQLKPKCRIPARQGTPGWGSHTCLGFAPSLSEPPTASHCPPSLGPTGVPPSLWGAPRDPSGFEVGNKMPPYSQVLGTVLGCPPRGASPGGSSDANPTPRPRVGGVVPPSPLAHGCTGSTGSLVPWGAEPCPRHPASPGDGDTGARGSLGGAGNQSPPPGPGGHGGSLPCPVAWVLGASPER